MVKLPVDISAVVLFFVAHFYYPPPLRFSLLPLRSILFLPLTLPPPSPPSLSLVNFFARFLREFIIYKGESTPRACFVLRSRRLRESAYISWLVLLAPRGREVGPEGWTAAFYVLPCIKYPAITVITVTVLCKIARLPHRGRLRGLRPGPRTRM